MKKVIRFTASWCAPCKALASILEEVKTDLPIEVVDIDENKELAIQYRVRSVPTLVLVDESKELKRMTGVQAKNLVESWLND
jgi:thioredoxin 1